MAIRTIKEIVDTKGYILNRKDRKIFQEEDLQSFFGLSNDDHIEFILYDINDNQLPQGKYGNARYIPLTSENISDYFMIAEGTKLSSNELPSEYFIDVQRLIREAGYSQGLFKTQITLITKRLGSLREDDKMWIGEISPSKTEVRLYPLNRSRTSEELKERFNIFYTSKNFRDEVVPVVDAFVDKIKPSEAMNLLNDTEKESWVKKLKNEFKIEDMEEFFTRVYDKFMEAVNYEFSNRISDITSNNYGQPREDSPSLDLSVDDAVKKMKKILQQCINYYLPERNYQERPKFELSSRDGVEEVNTQIEREERDRVITTEAEVEELRVRKPADSKEKEVVFTPRPPDREEYYYDGERTDFDRETPIIIPGGTSPTSTSSGTRTTINRTFQ